MIFEILKNPMYSYLFVLTLVIFLVIFLWRKLTILESNFYILEKRVNLMKESKYMSKNTKDVAIPTDTASLEEGFKRAIFENMTDKKIERSNIVMNEIFGNNIFSTDKNCHKEDVTITFDTSKDDKEIIDKEIDDKEIVDKEIVDTIDTIIDEHIVSYDTKEENNDFENTSNASEFVFNVDEKYTQKKLLKLNMDKLKTICEKMNISTEGTKNQLITRILE